MLRIFKEHWPLAAGVTVLWGVVAVVVGMSVAKTHGQFIYVLDDGYIHMAIAKNLSQYGTWGITKSVFSSSFSSLLWPLLLSLVYFIVGVNHSSPLILNLLFAAGICVFAYLTLRKNNCSPSLNLTVLLLVIFVSPLPLLVLTGMEHVLHALITIAFVYLSAKLLAESETDSFVRFCSLLVLAVLLTMVRYEGVFLLFIVSLLFIVRRRILNALLLAVVGILPIVIYGGISISKGWHFFPNSLLLRCNTVTFSSLKNMVKFFLIDGPGTIVATPHIFVITLLTLFIFYFSYEERGGLWDKEQFMLVILFFTVYLHMQFVGKNWFGRYVAYLMVLGIFVVGMSYNRYLSGNLGFKFRVEKNSWPKYVVIMFILLFSWFVQRTLVSLVILPSASVNIYQQQYQMGLFARKFYQGQGVALADIGAVNYLAEVDCLDLYGLGSMDVAKAKLEGRDGTQDIDVIAKAHDVKIVMLDYSRFRGGLKVPKQWVNVGQWKISNNKVSADDRIAFYAVNSQEVDSLIANLKAFSPMLPRGVVQSGMYTEQRK